MPNGWDDVVRDTDNLPNETTWLFRPHVHWIPMQSQSSTKNTSPSRLRLTLWQFNEVLVFSSPLKARTRNARCSSTLLFGIFRSILWYGWRRDLITLLDGFGSQRSWPKFNADLHRFLFTLFPAWTLYTEQLVCITPVRPRVHWKHLRYLLSCSRFIFPQNF